MKPPHHLPIETNILELDLRRCLNLYRLLLCRALVCSWWSEGVGGRWKGGGREIPSILFLCETPSADPPAHLLSDCTSVEAAPPQELEDPQMSRHREDSGRLLLHLEDSGGILEFFPPLGPDGVSASSEGCWGQNVTKHHPVRSFWLASHLAPGQLAGLLVVAAVIRTKSSFLPPKVGFNIAWRAHLRGPLLNLAQSDTWNQMNQMCVLVEGIVTEANKLACLVLFLL